MLKYRDGPLLELNFYYGMLPEDTALVRVIRALARLGARLAGGGLAHTGPDAYEPFSFPHEWPRERILLDLDDLEAIQAAPDIRLVGVYMLDAGGLAQPGVADYVGLMGISREAAGIDHHPVGIDTDGTPFAALTEESDRAEARQLGLQAYRRFRAVVEATCPAYAALLPGHILQCPTDLQLQPSPHNFHDFYVSGPYVGAHNLAAIEDLYAGAYVEPVGDGLYISCHPCFNPRRVELPPDPARGAAVARVIGYAAAGEG
jgi:hypothetical protein